MSEQRRFERFDLGLPSRITVHGPAREGDEREPIDLTTENVSSGGAYFYTDRPLPEGTKVLMEIILPLEKLKRAKGTHALVKVEGRVLRVVPDGMAIRFDREFSIIPVMPEPEPEVSRRYVLSTPKSRIASP